MTCAQIVPGIRKFCSMSLPGISQLFFSFLTFLLLLAQIGGAITSYGTLTVEHGIFTGNSADNVIAPHSQCPYQNMLEIPAPEPELIVGAKTLRRSMEPTVNH